MLLVHRRRPPNQGLWNGLGGKLQAGETPLAGVQRELLEEADIALPKSSACRFTGIVTWARGVDPTGPSTGMYAFLAELPTGTTPWEGTRHSSEGDLCWHRWRGSATRRTALWWTIFPIF